MFSTKRHIIFAGNKISIVSKRGKVYSSSFFDKKLKGAEQFIFTSDFIDIISQYSGVAEGFLPIDLNEIYESESDPKKREIIATQMGMIEDDLAFILKGAVIRKDKKSIEAILMNSKIRIGGEGLRAAALDVLNNPKGIRGYLYNIAVRIKESVDSISVRLKGEQFDSNKINPSAELIVPEVKEEVKKAVSPQEQETLDLMQDISTALGALISNQSEPVKVVQGDDVIEEEAPLKEESSAPVNSVNSSDPRLATVESLLSTIESEAECLYDILLSANYADDQSAAKREQKNGHTRFNKVVKSIEQKLLTAARSPEIKEYIQKSISIRSKEIRGGGSEYTIDVYNTLSNKINEVSLKPEATKVAKGESIMDSVYKDCRERMKQFSLDTKTPLLKEDYALLKKERESIELQGELSPQEISDHIQGWTTNLFKDRMLNPVAKEDKKPDFVPKNKDERKLKAYADENNIDLQSLELAGDDKVLMDYLKGAKQRAVNGDLPASEEEELSDYIVKEEQRGPKVTR